MHSFIHACIFRERLNSRLSETAIRSQNPTLCTLCYTSRFAQKIASPNRLLSRVHSTCSHNNITIVIIFHAPDTNPAVQLSLISAFLNMPSCSKKTLFPNLCRNPHIHFFEVTTDYIQSWISRHRGPVTRSCSSQLCSTPRGRRFSVAGPNPISWSSGLLRNLGL